MGLLRSRSRSQRRFRLLVNVCPDILSVCPIVSVQYLLNHSTIFFNQTWYCGVISWVDVSCGKKLLTIFNVKVTVRAIIKIWLFLLYLLNCWSVCNQTFFDSTASWAGVSCGKIGLLHSRSRSQQKFKMSMNVSTDDFFWTTEHFVTKLGVVMQHYEPECHLEKNCLLFSRSRL